MANVLARVCVWNIVSVEFDYFCLLEHELEHEPEPEPELKPKLWFKCIPLPLCLFFKHNIFVWEYVCFATETQYCDKSKSMTFSCRSHLKLFDNLRAPAYTLFALSFQSTRINKAEWEREKASGTRRKWEREKIHFHFVYYSTMVPRSINTYSMYKSQQMPDSLITLNNWLSVIPQRRRNLRMWFGIERTSNFRLSCIRRVTTNKRALWHFT